MSVASVRWSLALTSLFFRRFPTSSRLCGAVFRMHIEWLCRYPSAVHIVSKHRRSTSCGNSAAAAGAMHVSGWVTQPWMGAAGRDRDVGPQTGGGERKTLSVVETPVPPATLPHCYKLGTCVCDGGKGNS